MTVSCPPLFPGRKYITGNQEPDGAGRLDSPCGRRRAWPEDSKSPATVPLWRGPDRLSRRRQFWVAGSGLPRGRVRARRSRERDRRSAGGPLQQSRPADRLQHAGALDRGRLGRRSPPRSSRAATSTASPCRSTSRISSMRMAGCPGSRRCGSRKAPPPATLADVFSHLPNHRHARISVSKLDSKTLSRTRHSRCDLRRQALVLALVLATPASSPSHGGPLAPHLAVLPATAPSAPVIAIANDKQQDYDIDLIVTMSGRCTTLKIAGRDLPCRAVKYFHSRARPRLLHHRHRRSPRTRAMSFRSPAKTPGAKAKAFTN